MHMLIIACNYRMNLFMLLGISSILQAQLRNLCSHDFRARGTQPPAIWQGPLHVLCTMPQRMAFKNFRFIITILYGVRFVSCHLSQLLADFTHCGSRPRACFYYSSRKVLQSSVVFSVFYLRKCWYVFRIEPVLFRRCVNLIIRCLDQCAYNRITVGN